MEEGISGPIRKFDETKSLLWVEPFDDANDRRAGRGLDGCLVEPGPGAESTTLWVVGIGIEIATPRMTEILVSQISFLSGCARSVR